MEICIKCGETKPLTEFQRDSRKKNGFRSRCKACVNPDAAVRSAKWRLANPDKTGHAIPSAKWRRANPDACRVHAWVGGYRVRCRKFGVTPVVVPFTREELVAQYGDGCFYCDDGVFEEIDHYIPVAAGGEHTLDNVVPACHACNDRKGKSRTGDLLLVNIYRAVRDAIAAYLNAAA